jgi:gamma-glutamyltranspeptidase/glutathione hydrolase
MPEPAPVITAHLPSECAILDPYYRLHCASILSPDPGRRPLPVQIRTVLLFIVLSTVAAGSWSKQAGLAMPDPWSAAVAEQVLTGGGNAVDAAVAAAFTLAVTHPQAGNIGGGGFLLGTFDDAAYFLDFRERAPAAAHRDMYLDAQGRVVSRRSMVGGLAVGVPGTVRGLAAVHRRFGSRPWSALVAPAIHLAREGFVVPGGMAALVAERLAEVGDDTNFAEYFGAVRDGQLFRQPELAATLAAIAADPDSFYDGQPARQLVAQMQASGGLITLQDLADYRAVWREPLRARWRQFEVLTAPPPSSGGIALLQLLSMRDTLSGHFDGLVHNSAPYVHLLAELEKRVFADRAEYLGDPDHVDVPVARLLAPDYLATRAAAVDPDAVSPAQAVTPGLEPTETTHLSVVDGDGNAVSLTYTLNWDFGAGVVVAGAGYLLNNQMDDFSASPGVPNLFGVVGNTQNAIAPGKRMLSSMTPTILRVHGKPVLVLGTPGGSTIFTSVFQVLLNLYDHEMDLQAAVDALRFHHQLPEADLIRHDQRTVPAATRAGLQHMGYRVQANDWGDLGDVQAVQLDGRGVTAAADSRGYGEARVVTLPP